MNGGGGSPALSERQRILIVTDAWAPQINGVVRTLEMLGRELSALGYHVQYATPQGHSTVPLPTYPEIRLSVFPRRALRREVAVYQPHAVHIATEGPLGFAARAICVQRKIPFTTSYHTRFPDYVRARLPFVSEDIVYSFLRWFHAPATAMMVATPALAQEMTAHGFKNLRQWSRGVDVAQFRPIMDASLPFPGPLWLYVGRIAVEKNLEAFLSLDLPGTKLLVGDGPARESLQQRFPQAEFLGAKTGDDLAKVYSASDVFVFPSRTDTFGLVMLEALACGTPVAAFPVQGPKDVFGDAAIAALDEDLGAACSRALRISRQACRDYALTRSWRACTAQFLSNLTWTDRGS